MHDLYKFLVEKSYNFFPPCIKFAYVLLHFNQSHSAF